MSAISLVDVTHAYLAEDRVPAPAIRDVSLSIGAGELCAVVGPSGCGKSTLLRLIAGLMLPTRGRISIGTTLVTGPSSAAAVVFQEYSRSLLPWLTIEDNVALALTQAGSRGAAAGRAGEYLDAVGLTASRRRYPWQLSGGMQQRVAIARALAGHPQVLLLDEPFGSLDALSRLVLEDLVMDTQQRFGLTVLLVTHDIDEAVYMADRVFVMDRRGSMLSTTGTAINLPRPRNQATTRRHNRFSEVRGQLLRDLGVLTPASWTC